MRRGASYRCALDLLVDQSGATAGGFSSIATTNLGGADSREVEAKTCLKWIHREKEGEESSDSKARFLFQSFH